MVKRKGVEDGCLKRRESLLVVDGHIMAQAFLGMVVNKDLYKVKGTNPNTEPEASDDLVPPTGPSHQIRRSERQRPDGSHTTEETTFILLKKGLPEEDVRMNIFVIEGLKGFNGLSVREKMSEVMLRSTDEIKRWYFRKGGRGELAAKWNDMKEELIKYITSRGIEGMVKYADEMWSSYIQRLWDYSIQHEMPENTTIEALKSLKTPTVVQTLLYSTDIKIDSIIKFTEAWEKDRIQFGDTRTYYRQNRTGGRENIKCFSCGLSGHISRDCRRGHNFSNKGEITKQKEDKDIQINNRYVYSLFDSGSEFNILTYSGLRKIGNPKAIKLESPITIFMLNGTSIRSYMKTYVLVEYNGIKVYEWFYIINNGLVDIIVGQSLKEKLEKKEGFPIDCEINTREGVTVSWYRPLGSQYDKIKFQELVDSMEKKGFIEPTKSSWLNPVVLIRKKTGEYRFTLDLRKLNDQVPLDEYEIPRIQETVRSLKGNKYFSLLDLKDGFFQVPLREEDKDKTAFLDGRGRLMRFRVMPQGFKNSPPIFQRGINIVLQDYIGSKCVAYIDDILVFGRTVNEHDQNLEAVKERLKKHKLVINEEKSIIRKTELNFLGYTITEDIIRPLLNRAQGIISYPTPQTKKELRRFIGSINYDRNFIKNLSQELAPLYEVLKKPKFEWSEVESNCFEKVRSIWKRNLEVNMPDFTQKFTLETDASNTGLGAVLKQYNRPVAYASRLLKDAEKGYTITEKEVLAALWGMEKFKYFLLGNRFDLVTDHKAIESIKIKKEFGTPRIQRWLERLALFEFEVIFKSGSAMGQADSLSRGCYDKVPEKAEKKNTELQILKFHRDNNHRKTLFTDLKNKGVEISQREFSEIVSNCEICNKVEKKKEKGCSFIYTDKVGDLFGIDILELRRGEKILLGIDYFSRYLFGARIKTKEASKVIKFLEIVREQIPIRKLISDSGKEFKNTYLSRWCSSKGIEQDFTIPYHHQSNGRIERVNQTIRTAFKKYEGQNKYALQNIIENYNNTIHRAIGMAPTEGLKESSRRRILEHQRKYSEEFKKYSGGGFNLGDVVYIRNELKKTKMDLEYNEKGIVSGILGENSYSIRKDNGRAVIKHATQLKFCERNVGHQDVHFKESVILSNYPIVLYQKEDETKMI